MVQVNSMDALVTAPFREALEQAQTPQIEGAITAVQGLLVEARIPHVPIGALVQHGAQMGQVVGADGERVQIAPLDNWVGAQPGDRVRVVHRVPMLAVGDTLLGRVVDPLLRPIDDSGALDRLQPWPLWRDAPNALTRPPVNRMLSTGIKVIDGLLPLGVGQKTGLFAGAGQGKSTLLADIATGASCDVSVICLAGERGREAGEFVRETLGRAGLKKSVVVLATSDSAAAMKVMAFQSAVALAEWFRNNGLNVLLLLDSLTRVLRGRRDLDVSLGHTAGPLGFPAPTFGFLPSWLERATSNAQGQITSVYTVLAEDAQADPVAQELRSLLDGHIVLSRTRAEAGHWPAVDVPASVSRVFNAVADGTHGRDATTLRGMIAAHAQNEELIKIGAYCAGTCPQTDAYLKAREEIVSFLTQPRGHVVSRADMLAEMADIV